GVVLAALTLRPRCRYWSRFCATHSPTWSTVAAWKPARPRSCVVGGWMGRSIEASWHDPCTSAILLCAAICSGRRKCWPRSCGWITATTAPVPEQPRHARITSHGAALRCQPLPPRRKVVLQSYSLLFSLCTGYL